MHSTSPFLRRRLAYVTLSLSAAASAPLAAQTVSYAQGTFNAADWDQVAPTQTGAFSLSLGVGGGGNFWFITQSAPAGNATGAVQSVLINRLFTYNPATNGALSVINFSFDLLGVSTVNFGGAGFGFFRPVIRQGGVIFSVANTNAAPTLGVNSTRTFAHRATDNWIARSPGDLRIPDFSATGGVIDFGWRFDGGGNCASGNCIAPSTTTNLDNFSVEVVPTVQSTVPEPSTYALMAFGLIGLLAVARRRRVVTFRNNRGRTTTEVQQTYLITETSFWMAHRP